MALKIPTSIDQVVYFTNRAKDKLRIKAWTYKKVCPKCKKGLMGKPIDPKTGKRKIRATEYICPECNYSEEKKAHEESLTLEAQYTCPACGKSGESTCVYKRKTFMGVPSYIITCQHCSEKIPITKKLRDPKAKKGAAATDEEDDEDDE